VIVALFLGLTVARKRSSATARSCSARNSSSLSRLSYLLSKMGILFIISAIQTALFTWWAMRARTSPACSWQHWVVLFSTSCFANVLGLNVSASFNSAKVIYIIIPVLIIPQLLFSGIIVRFDKLHPWFASEKQRAFGSATSWPAAGPMKAWR
jgi:amino acid transporter